ncbi:MAG: type II secretion system F family protein [Acidimicrobiia bacterium]
MGSVEFAAVAVFVAVAALAYYLGLGVVRGQAASRLVALRSRRDRMEASFAERAVAPVFQNLGKLAIRATPVGWAKRVRQRLVHAGLSDRFDANSWAAVRLLALGIAAAGWYVAQGELTQTTHKTLAAVLLAAFGFFGPDAVLSRRIDERKKKITLQLPDILDLLVISVEAGLGFESAMARVVGTVPGELSDEFGRMLQETRIGISRSQAMQNLGERTDVEELNSFLMAMNQAETFGVSISRVLRVQSEELRIRRRQKAQEKAFAAPVKMVFPLILCIFPSIFVVLMGPAAIAIFENVINR